MTFGYPSWAAPREKRAILSVYVSVVREQVVR